MCRERVKTEWLRSLTIHQHDTTAIICASQNLHTVVYIMGGAAVKKQIAKSGYVLFCFTAGKNWTF